MQNFTNGTSDSYSGMGYEMRLLAKDSPHHRPSNLISLTSEEYDRSQVSVPPPDLLGRRNILRNFSIQFWI